MLKTTSALIRWGSSSHMFTPTKLSVTGESPRDFIKNCIKALQEELPDITHEHAPYSSWDRLWMNYHDGHLTAGVPDYFQVSWTVVNETIPTDDMFVHAAQHARKFN